MSFYIDKLAVEERQAQLLREAQQERLARAAKSGKTRSDFKSLLRSFSIQGAKPEPERGHTPSYPSTACAEG